MVWGEKPMILGENKYGTLYLYRKLLNFDLQWGKNYGTKEKER